MQMLSVEASLKKAKSKIRKNDFQGALQIYNQILSSYPKNPQALNGKKRITQNPAPANTNLKLQELTDLFSKGDYHLSITKAEKLTNFLPENFRVWYILGSSHLHLRNADSAIFALKRSLALNPDFAATHNNLAVTEQYLGNFISAKKHYAKAVKLDPNYIEALENLVELSDSCEGDELLPKLISAYINHKNNEQQLMRLCFALGKLHEAQNNFAQSLSFFQQGNAIKKRQLKYHIDLDKRLFDRVKSTSRKIFKKSLKIPSGGFERSPIFILGMPRSGTSLIEKIISAHPSVFGAGETEALNRLGSNLIYGYDEPTEQKITNIRKLYMEKVSVHSNGELLITDKMPNNFLRIALIGAAFPESKIIHVKRNPAATCWSNFTKNYSGDGIGFSYDLSDLTQYYRMYEDLMLFWKTKHDLQIFDLNYESFTESPDLVMKNVFDFLELEWKSVYLNPSSRSGIVTTASSYQARQKIYRGSSEHWKKFEPHLAGVFDTFTSKTPNSTRC